MSIVLEDCGIAREDILNSVVERLVAQLYDGRILGEVQAKVQAKAMAIVEERVSLAVDDLLSKPLQRTNLFGEPTGEPISIKDMMAESLVNWWTAKVNCDGKAGGYGSKLTRAEYLTNKAAAEILEKDLRVEYNKLITELRTEIRTSFSKAVAELIQTRLSRS